MATVAHVDARFTADTTAYVNAVRSAQHQTKQFADVVAGVSGQAGDAARGVAGAGAAAQNASGGFTILKGAMATAFGVGAVDAIKKTFGAVKNFARSSFEAAARVEELNIAMVAIGNSTGVGEKAITDAAKAIRANGIEMAASQQIAIEFAQNQLDLASASKVARVAQDLAVIGAKNSTDTTQRLTRAIITGNSVILKSAGISRTATEAYQEYAATLGKGVRELTAVERQQAMINLILSEGEKVAGTYEASMDAAGKVLRSFPRIFNDIKVEAGGVLSKAFGPLIKATYDLVSAFSKALRDGGSLTGVLETMTEVMVKMTEPMVEIIKQFTEMVKSGEVFDKITKTVQESASVFLAVSDATRAFMQALVQLLIPALQAVLDASALLLAALKPLADLFSRMPDFVKIAVGALILFRTAMGAKLLGAIKAANVAVISLGTTSKIQFASMRAAATLTTASVLASFTNMRVGMEMLKLAGKSLQLTLVTNFRVIAIAAKGMLAAIGPVGWALIGVATAFEVFSGRSAHAEEMLQRMIDTADEATGAFTDLTAAMMGEQFRMDLSAEDQRLLEQMGIGVNEAVTAIMSGGEAVDAFREKITALRKENLHDFNTQQLLRIFEDNFGGMAKTAEDAYERMEEKQQAFDHAAYVSAMKSQQLNKQRSADLRQRFKDEREGIERTHSAVSGLERAHSNYADLAERNQSRITTVTNATEAAVRALQGAYAELETLFSDVRAADRAYLALQEMHKQLASNTEGIDDYSDAAMANRDKMLAYGDAQIAYAKSLKDPQAELQALMDLEAEVIKALANKKIDPKDSDLVKSIQAALDEAKEKVGEMEEAAGAAEAAGLDITAAIAAGVKAGMSQQESAIEAAGMAGGEALAEGFEDALGISSPSRVAIEAGRNTGLGLIEGLNQMNSAAEGAGMNIGANIVRGMLTALRNGEGPIAAAARALVAAGIRAAKEESQEGSPSRVFMGIGDNMVKGLAEGLERTTPMAVDATASLITSMRDSGELAVDALVSGMESRRSAVQSAISSLSQGTRALSPMVDGGLMVNMQAALPTMPQATASQDPFADASRKPGIHIENLNVTSAPGERADASLPRQLRRMAWVAGLDG